jgi:hypothetical protein
VTVVLAIIAYEIYTACAERSRKPKEDLTELKEDTDRKGTLDDFIKKEVELEDK